MAVKTEYAYFADFETVVFPGQDSTEVWAAGIAGMEGDVEIFNNLPDFIKYVKKLIRSRNIKVYFHNARFDCSFLLDYFLRDKKIKQATTGNIVDHTLQFLPNKAMPSNSIKYVFSDKGQFYSLTYCVGTHRVEFIDSLKLLPFPLETIGKNFCKSVRKGSIQYVGERHAYGEITEEEGEYLKNDVLILREAMQYMFEKRHTRLTIGSCCLNEFRQNYGLFDEQYKLDFPDLRPYESPVEGKNMFDYIHEAYRGAWCYVMEGKQGKVYKKGLTLDVNSLYSSVMHSDSGNYYPVGLGRIFQGEIPEKVLNNNHYYFFVRIRCRFKLKSGKLPFIQIKNTFRYKGNDMLKTSDILYHGKYYSYYRDKDGEIKPADVELTLTCTDWYRLNEFYDLYDLQILDGVYFHAAIGIFDDYINKYAALKINAKNKAERTLAKLFLNNLYGKFAATDDSSFKYAYIDKDKDHLCFVNVPANNKTPGYIPVGAAITSYARDFIIRKAEENYDRFIYADTDSLHMEGTITDVKACNLHESKFLCFKCETLWDTAVFIRQKSYVEHVTHENLDPVSPYFNIICAGMPDKCKEYVKSAMELSAQPQDKIKKYYKKLFKKYRKETKTVKKFVYTPLSITDFKPGLEVPGKLQQTYIKGGMILGETTYKIKESVWRI